MSPWAAQARVTQSLYDEYEEFLAGNPPERPVDYRLTEARPSLRGQRRTADRQLGRIHGEHMDERFAIRSGFEALDEHLTAAFQEAPREVRQALGELRDRRREILKNYEFKIGDSTVLPARNDDYVGVAADIRARITMALGTHQPSPHVARILDVLDRIQSVRGQSVRGQETAALADLTTAPRTRPLDPVSSRSVLPDGPVATAPTAQASRPGSGAKAAEARRSAPAMTLPGVASRMDPIPEHEDLVLPDTGHVLRIDAESGRLLSLVSGGNEAEAGVQVAPTADGGLLVHVESPADGSLTWRYDAARVLESVERPLAAYRGGPLDGRRVRLRFAPDGGLRAVDLVPQAAGTELDADVLRDDAATRLPDGFRVTDRRTSAEFYFDDEARQVPAPVPVTRHIRFGRGAEELSADALRDVDALAASTAREGVAAFEQGRPLPVVSISGHGNGTLLGRPHYGRAVLRGEKRAEAVANAFTESLRAHLRSAGAPPVLHAADFPVAVLSRGREYPPGTNVTDGPAALRRAVITVSHPNPTLADLLAASPRRSTAGSTEDVTVPQEMPAAEEMRDSEQPTATTDTPGPEQHAPAPGETGTPQEAHDSGQQPALEEILSPGQPSATESLREPDGTPATEGTHAPDRPPAVGDFRAPEIVPVSEESAASERAIASSSGDGQARSQQEDEPVAEVPWYVERGALGEVTVHDAETFAEDMARQWANRIASEVTRPQDGVELVEGIRDALRGLLVGASGPGAAEDHGADGPTTVWDSALQRGLLLVAGEHVVWLRPVLKDLTPAPPEPREGSAAREYKVSFAGLSSTTKASTERPHGADVVPLTILSIAEGAGSLLPVIPLIGGQWGRQRSAELGRAVVAGRKVFVKDTLRFRASGVQVHVFVDGERRPYRSENEPVVPARLTVDLPSDFTRPGGPRLDAVDEPGTRGTACPARTTRAR